MKKKFFLTVLLACISVLALCSLNVSAEVYNNIKYEVTDTKTVTVIGLVSYQDEVVIPSKIGGYPVTSIGEQAFKGMNPVSVTLPNTVTSIGSYAFADCEDLCGITIPGSVTSIGSGAFSRCQSLSEITLPRGITRIESDTFYDCESLTYIEIPDSVTGIGKSAFSRSALMNIDIPDSVKDIGDFAFNYCSYLESATIPDAVTSIGENVFSYCVSLKTVNIPDSVTSIGKQAFMYCEKLTAVTGLQGVTSIGENAFIGCIELACINIPDGVTTIGNSAFLRCSSLTEINIPGSVTELGSGVFNKCAGLTNIIIPDSVTSIGERTFANCTGLTEIIIPDSVTSIGDTVFFGCSNLETVYYNGTEEEWNRIKEGSAVNAERKNFGYVTILNEDGKQLKKDFYAADSLLDAAGIAESLGYIPVFYTDEKLTDKFDISTPITGSITLYTANPRIKPGGISASGDGKNAEVIPINIPVNSTVIFACYSDGKLVELKFDISENKTINFQTDTDFDTAKVMVWDKLTRMEPICGAEKAE